MVNEKYKDSLLDLRFDGHAYKLTVSAKRSSFLRWDDFKFVLNQKETEHEKLVFHSIVEETDSDIVMEINITLDEIAVFKEGERLDLFLVRQRENEEKWSPVLSSGDYIELLEIELDSGKMLRPITTNQGNVAFTYDDDKLFARFDHVEIDENNALELYGLFHHQDFGPSNVEKLELIAYPKKGGEPFVYEAHSIGLPDIYEEKPWSSDVMDNGFQAVVDLMPYIKEMKPESLSFHLRITYRLNGELDVLESNRLTVNPNVSILPIKRKESYAGHDMLIGCGLTKARKYLYLVIEYDQPVRNACKKGKQKLIKIRRGKQMVEVYRKAFTLMSKVSRVDSKLVVFESFHGKQYSDNPRAIYEFMKKRRTNYELVWSADRRYVNEFAKKGIPHVRRFSFKWLLLMTRAGHWVTNARLPLWIPKPAHTTYLQTWHGTPLKRLASDMEEVHMPGTNTAKYKENFTLEASKWDYLVSPNAYSTEIFRRAFQFDKDMLETGYPRNDYLYTANNDRTIARIKRQLGIAEEKKVILYAPTWRDNQFYQKGAYKFDLQMDLDQLQREFGETHAIILRMHYLIAENLDISAYEGFVYDCSAYEDIRDLYLISDVLITDYSSVFFDYANLRRPMMFFVYDIEDYRDNLRGFYFDFEEKAPGPLVRTTEEMIRELKKIENEGFKPDDNYKEFIERFCYLEDGDASERVVKEVFDQKK